jgi:hypothetical protein
MISLHDDKYLIRESLYNLVELSLLARMYEQYCVPSANGGRANPESLAQTLLKMKASEKQGQLRVAIFAAEPVGFYWKFQDKVMAHWVQPEHRLEGIEQSLLGPM